MPGRLHVLAILILPAALPAACDAGGKTPPGRVT